MEYVLNKKNNPETFYVDPYVFFLYKFSFGLVHTIIRLVSINCFRALDSLQKNCFDNSQILDTINK